MKKFVLMTDSTCDLPEESVRQHGLDIMCFKIALDGEGYTERIDFKPEQFCQMLREAKGLPMTSQITQYEFYERFEKHAQNGVENLIYVSINGSGSGTYAAACTAAADFKRKHPESRMHIDVVDSHTYSMAEGAPVIRAAEMMESGCTAEETVSYLNDIYSRMEVLLVAYTLKVIRKSGRISAAAAIAGEVLGIHPIFTLNDGISQVVRKIRGEKAAAHAMAEIMKERMVKGKPYYIMASDAKYFDEYRRFCEAATGYAPAGIGFLGSAVLSNTGPDAVGLVFEGEKRIR